MQNINELPISLLSYYIINPTRELKSTSLKEELINRLTKYKLSKNDSEEIITAEQNKIERRNITLNNYLLSTPKTINEIVEFLNNYKINIESKNKESLESLLIYSDLTISEIIYIWDILCKMSNLLRYRKQELERELSTKIETQIELKNIFNIIKELLKSKQTNKEDNISLGKETAFLNSYENLSSTMRVLGIMFSGMYHYDLDFMNYYKKSPIYYNTNPFFDNETRIMKENGLYEIINENLKDLKNIKEELPASLVLK